MSEETKQFFSMLGSIGLAVLCLASAGVIGYSVAEKHERVAILALVVLLAAFVYLLWRETHA